MCIRDRFTIPLYGENQKTNIAKLSNKIFKQDSLIDRFLYFKRETLPYDTRHYVKFVPIVYIVNYIMYEEDWQIEWPTHIKPHTSLCCNNNKQTFFSGGLLLTWNWLLMVKHDIVEMWKFIKYYILQSIMIRKETWFEAVDNSSKWQFFLQKICLISVFFMNMKCFLKNFETK